MFVVGHAFFFIFLHFRVENRRYKKKINKCIALKKYKTGFGRNELRRNFHVENMRVPQEEDERVEGKPLFREQ